jgi:hypothetical protein
MFSFLYGVKPLLTAQPTSRSETKNIRSGRLRVGGPNRVTSGSKITNFRGLEQNPDANSKWAAMARNGRKVMQFLDGGRYVAVVADGELKTYG